MPTNYSDQFWIIDPFNPPPRGTTLTVNVFNIVDQNDDGLLDAASGDSINGSDITSSYLGDWVVARVNGVNVRVDGATFYLANGTQVFTPTDGTILSDATFIRSFGVTGQTPVPLDSFAPPCFTSGTRISTPDGEREVQKLKAGDMVLDSEDAPVVLRAIMSRPVSAAELRRNPKLRPVRICAGALGCGLPHRDLLVSHQHRMMVSSKIAERMFGSQEVLVPAVRLTDLPGIYVDDSDEPVTYFHLLFDTHQVIRAERAPTESLFLGREALKSVSAEARQEICSIFPEVNDPSFAPVPARPVPIGKKQRKLVERHALNLRPLLQPGITQS